MNSSGAAGNSKMLPQNPSPTHACPNSFTSNPLSLMSVRIAFLLAVAPFHAVNGQMRGKTSVPCVNAFETPYFCGDCDTWRDHDGNSCDHYGRNPNLCESPTAWSQVAEPNYFQGPKFQCPKACSTCYCNTEKDSITDKAYQFWQCNPILVFITLAGAWGAIGTAIWQCIFPPKTKTDEVAVDVRPNERL